MIAVIGLLIDQPPATSQPSVATGRWASDRSASCAATERDADGIGWHDGLLMDLLAEEHDQPRDTA
jgi:hypothetical protein